MSSTNTYYVNVDSRYRDTEKYPDSTDFAVTFQRFQGTGTFAQGLPLNSDSFFEQGSIDPDFDNDNLQIVNGTITTYNRVNDDTIVIGGFFTNTMSITIGSSGSTIYTMPSVNQTSSFVTSIKELDTSNYSLNWFIYGKMATGNNGIVNYTTKTAVQMTNDNQLYVMFDFTMTKFDIFFTNDPLGLDVVKFTTVDNVNSTLGYDYNVSAVITYTPLYSIFIGLIDLDGSLGYVNGHSYGYHILNSNTSINPINVNGSNSLEIDISSNLYPGFNVNPYSGNFVFSNLTYNYSINLEENPYGMYLYTGTDGFMYSTVCTNMYYNGTNSDYAYFYPFSYVISRHSDTSITASQPLKINPTGTKNCAVSNKFVQWSTGVYGITSTAGAMSGASDLAKSSSIYINKLEPYGLTGTNLATINLSYAACIDAYVYNNLIYIFIRESRNTFRVYTFNPSTLGTSSIASISLPSTVYNATQLRGYVLGTKVYIFSQDQIRQDPVNPTYIYDKFLTGKCYVIEFNLLTNGLSIVNTFTSNIPDWYTIEDRGSVKYMYVQSVNKPIMQIYDVTSPTGVSMVNEITTADFMIPIPFKIVKDGVTNYYLAGSVKVNIGGIYIYNTDDITNITKYQNIKSDSGFINYIDIRGRFYSQLKISNGYFYKAISQGDLIFKDTQINSSQYSLNNQNTFTGLTSDYLRHINITIGSSTYCLVFSQTNIKVLDITILRNIYEYSNIPISLSDIPWYLNIIEYNNTIHLLVCSGNNLYFYVLSEDATSVELIDVRTYAYKTVEVLTTIYNDQVISILSLEQRFLYKLQIDPAIGIIQRSYWDGAAIVPYPVYIGSATIHVYSDNSLIYLGHQSSTNFTPTPGASRTLFVNFSTDVNNSGTIALVEIPGGCPSPRGCVKLTNTKYNRIYNVDYISAYNSVYVYDLSSLTNASLLGSTNAGDSYGYYPVFALNTPNNTYYGFISSSTTGPKGHYISFYDVSNIKSTVGDSLFFDVGVSSSTGPAISMQLETVITNNNRYILTSLNTGGSMYFYDVTNPEFAGKYQQGSFTTTSYTGINGINSSIIMKIDNEGNDTWMSYLGSNTTPQPGENINLSNMRVNNNSNELITAGSWINNIQSYTYNSGTYSNNISSNTPYYCSYITKQDLTFGIWKWVIPIVGNSDCFIQKVQLLSNNNIIVAGYTYSNYLEIFYPQTSSSSPRTSLVQSTLIEPNSNASSFVLNFDANGNILWKTSIYTTDSNRYIIIKDCGVQNDIIFVSGITNASNVFCTDSSGNQPQDLIFDIYSPSTQSNIFIYIFDLKGNYIKSEQIVLPNSSSVSLYDIKYYSSNNKFYFCPNVYIGTDGVNIYNSDGSIAKKSYYSLNKFISPIITYYYSNYYVDTNGNNYSRIVYNNPPTYAFTGVNYNNYNVFIVGNQGDTYLNKSFSVRTNTITQDTNGNNEYSLILNSVIPINKIDRTPFSVNGSTGGDKSFSLSASPLQDVISYSSIDTVNNMLTLDYYSQDIDTTQFYYITIPLLDGTIRNVPVKSIEQTLTNYEVYLDDVNQLRVSPSGAFYGPYLYLTNFNKNVFYNLEMFPASLIYPVYYVITLNSLTIPNRPLREVTNNFTIKNFNSIPYFYLAIYNTDDNDNPDYEIVNIVYDNNPNKERFALFQIPTSVVSDNNNWITLSSQVKSKIKFLPTYRNLRIQLFDCYGNKIKFDNTPYKTGDSAYVGSVVPPELMNLNLNFTLQKF